LDVPGLCAHDLKAAAKLSLEISSALERTSSMALSQQSSEARTRLELARDLHDSIVQLLAGTSLRLEAIKTAAASGQDVGAEIEALLLELAQEQKEVRSFISNLRTCGGVATPRDIAAGICQLTERLAQQWRIRCELDTGTETMSCSAALEHNLHQLIREGIANAVKHGGAQRVVIKIRSDPKAVHLEIADTGAGFRPEANICLAKVPQSLEDRVQSLGGHLAVSASDKGAKVSITLAREIRT
jgi:signal transduction histidine kinase